MTYKKTYTTTELTKKIQEAVHVTVDGIWGINTATAVWQYIQNKKENTDTAEELEEAAVLGAWEINDNDLITEPIHKKCVQTINVFETGSKEGDYSNVSIYKDGGGGSYKQITYGAAQTTQDGNLDKLLTAYLDTGANTKAASVIRSYLPTKNNRNLVNNDEFIKALKDAGKEKEMQTAQDAFFDETYFVPAYKWFAKNGFTYPLSLLVIYDSFIHSGGILSFLRNRFAEVVPNKGGNEKKWIESYVNVRKSWLSKHSNKILRNTVYRMNTMLECINNDNWMLDKPYKANGIIIS